MERVAKLLLRPGESPKDQAVRKRLGTLGSGVGIGVNALLVALKLFVGSVTGSVAVVADAVDDLFLQFGRKRYKARRVTAHAYEQMTVFFGVLLGSDEVFHGRGVALENLAALFDESADDGFDDGLGRPCAVKIPHCGRAARKLFVRYLSAGVDRRRDSLCH